MEFFLLFSLFFPRVTLLIAYIAGDTIPVNNVPLFFDVLGGIIFPRMLIMYYIWYAELGVGWMIAHIIALIISKAMKTSSDD